MFSARLLVGLGVVSLLGLWAPEARAVGVPAGTSIDNTAQVTYTVGSVSATATSNTATVTVAEIIDVVVTLHAALRGDRVEFTVRDNGPGIAPSLQSKVFEPFFSTRPAGTGLGLAVVKTVAEAHGGHLALKSEHGSGTRIDIDLPRSTPADTPSPAAPAREVA